MSQSVELLSMWTIYHYCLCLASEEKKVHITRRWKLSIRNAVNCNCNCLKNISSWKNNYRRETKAVKWRRVWMSRLSVQKSWKSPKCSFPIFYNSLPFITPQTQNFAQRCQWRFSHRCDDFLRDELFRIICRA